MHAVKTPKQRGLAAAGWPYQSGDIIFIDRQIDISQGMDIPRIIEIKTFHVKFIDSIHHLWCLPLIKSLPMTVSMRIESVITRDAPHACECQLS